MRVPASETGFLADLRGLAGKEERCGEGEAHFEAEIMKQSFLVPGLAGCLERDGDLSVDWESQYDQWCSFLHGSRHSNQSNNLFIGSTSCPHLYSV